MKTSIHIINNQTPSATGQKRHQFGVHHLLLTDGRGEQRQLPEHARYLKFQTRTAPSRDRTSKLCLGIRNCVNKRDQNKLARDQKWDESYSYQCSLPFPSAYFALQRNLRRAAETLYMLLPLVLYHICTNILL